MVDNGHMTEEEKNSLKMNITFVEDERMPYYIQDGKKVYADILLNSSGAIRRLNPGQLVEVEFNFIAEQVQYMIHKAETFEEKEAITFKFIECVNKDMNTFFRDIYDSYDETKSINGVSIRFKSDEYKEAFIRDVEENGFYIVRPPHKPLLFDDIIRLYDEFPEIKPVDIYVDLFGTKQRKTMRKGVIGYQYMLILKQNSNKNFSARSTFRVNRSNLPAKDIAKKTNRSSYARTPVRLSEVYNLMASITGRDLAEHNVFTRSSALGRKSLDRIIAASGNPLDIKKLKIKDNFTNINADILAAKLKTLGLRIYFSPSGEGKSKVYDDTSACALHFGDYVVYDYPRNRKMYQDLFDAFHEEMSKQFVIESYPGEKHDICWDKIFENKDITDKYNITDDMKDLLKNTTKSHEISIREVVKKPVTRKSNNSNTVNMAPKKRGRKSKAEKEELLKQQHELEQSMGKIPEEEIAEEYYDD